jgi:uncharacterized membrane protein
MHSWSREEKIAFWSLVVAVVSCLVAIVSAPAFNRGASSASNRGIASFTDTTVVTTAPPVMSDTQAERLNRERADLQQRIREEQRRAEGEENMRLYWQRVTLRMARMESLAGEMAASGAPGYYTIRLQNDCSDTINVALYYRDLDDRWVLRGWWIVGPQEATKPGEVWTRNSIVYFYAYNENTIWSGSSDSLAMQTSLPDKRFYLLADEANPFQTSNPASMFRRDLGSVYSEFNQAFTCANNTEMKM